MKSIRHNSGLSMLEIMVVVAVIAILSTIVLANYSSFDKKILVNTAAQNLASNMRKAQSYSLSGKIFSNNDGRWGLYFMQASSSYVIFADSNKNDIYNVGESYSIIDLPKNVTIGSFLNAGASSSILYIPPEPRIVIRSSNFAAATSAEEIILINASGYKKKVQINSFGLVDVND